MTNNEIVPGFDDDKDDSLKIELQKTDNVANCLILILTGYIDTYNSNSFQKRIAKCMEAGYNRLIFDCAALSYVSSTGIGSFTLFLKNLKNTTGDIVLLDVQPKVCEVFQLLGFSQFFNMTNDKEDAISFFTRTGAAPGTSVFPRIFTCPICNKKLKAVKSGRFRCSACKTILAVNPDGAISLG